MLFSFSPANDFARLKDITGRRGVKLLLLTGESNDKAQFVNSCLKRQTIDIVKLGAMLSPRLLMVSADSIGCEIRDFLSDLHDDGPVFIDDIELLFDVGMDINVLSVLKYAARTRLLVVNWPGSLDSEAKIIYFARGDIQQKSYSIDSDIVVYDESGVIYPENI